MPACLIVASLIGAGGFTAILSSMAGDRQAVSEQKPSGAAPSLWRSWMRREEAEDPHDGRKHGTHPWYRVIWLTGVDYFSTLGYQPGIALLAAGALSPIATAVLVAVTLLCALPVYWPGGGALLCGAGFHRHARKPAPGWWSKLMVLVLLGFATTDFVITMTLSASDAARACHRRIRICIRFSATRTCA